VTEANITKFFRSGQGNFSITQGNRAGELVESGHVAGVARHP
jgi:hypothetical protein